ncbi:MAG: hypothetical protein AMJ77_06545 [Dehalococcoidia bacterium SM23_28_2]|nr:MAG: hypothetical protein AMJ77_06545 [Dehalococcoidia bacterium SM23_28_2]
MHKEHVRSQSPDPFAQFPFQLCDGPIKCALKLHLVGKVRQAATEEVSNHRRHILAVELQRRYRQVCPAVGRADVDLVPHRFKEGLALLDLEGYAVGARRVGGVYPCSVATLSSLRGGAKVNNERFHACPSSHRHAQASVDRQEHAL